MDRESTYVNLGSTYVDVCRPKFMAVDPRSMQGPIPHSTALLKSVVAVIVAAPLAAAAQCKSDGSSESSE